MSTVLVVGVGELGGWAVELLARSPGVERIVTVKRSPWAGVSRPTIAMLGAVFQGHRKRFEHHQIDVLDVDSTARLLSEVQPHAIIHSATVQSPRSLMHSRIESSTRDILKRATFGMWLPWHLLPVTRLVEAVDSSGIETHIVNAAFPDVVNPALWRRFGHGPRAGAGNVEVCAARVFAHAVESTGADPATIDVRMVGSHALLSYGPAVPHAFSITIDGEDRTDDFDLDHLLVTWPEPIDWKRVDVFSLFAASAVKNALALLGTDDIDTHVTSPDGLPGGYPATVGRGRISLRLPPGIEPAEAISLNEAAARWDAVDSIESDGTVVYTEEAAAAMSELGYAERSVRFDDLEEQSRRLTMLARALVAERKST